jgi:hypothetical protein
MKEKDDESQKSEEFDEEKYFEEFGNEEGALSQLLKFAKDGPFQGWETLSDLKEPDRVNHLRLRVLGWMVKEIEAEVKALTTGERNDENTFGSLLELVQEKDLKLRVSHKRKGRGELVNMIVGGKAVEARRKFFRGK